MSGRVEWIGLRAKRGEPMVVVESVVAIAGRGLEGDRASRGREGHKRQATLVQAEHLPVIAKLAGRERVEPTDLRRNIVVSGINLVGVGRRRVRIGDEVVVVATGPCDPCFKLRDLEEPAGGMGGITARIEVGGVIRVGDRVEVDAPESPRVPRRGSR